MRFFGKHRDFLASSLWHVCALLCVHSPDKGQAESSQGIWFDLKNAELGADVCVFVCGGVLIRTGPFPMSIHFFSPSYQILANVTTLVAFLRTRKKKRARVHVCTLACLLSAERACIHLCHSSGVWLATHWPFPKACEHHVYVFVLTLKWWCGHLFVKLRESVWECVWKRKRAKSWID